MKYKIIRIKEFPLKKIAKKLGISIRQISILSGVKNTYVNEASLGRCCLSEKSALRVIKAVEKLKSNDNLRSKLIKNGNYKKIHKSMYKEIKKMRKNNVSLQEIGIKFGVSRERIRQILSTLIEQK